MDFDVLIVGGGVAGMSCALLLGSGLTKDLAEGKKVGIILHQKASHLQNARLNNVLGLSPGTSGKDILISGAAHLANQYPEVVQIQNERVNEIQFLTNGFHVLTNKNQYQAQKTVIAIGYTGLSNLKGLERYVIPHGKAKATKNRIQLKNIDHVVAPGLYVSGTLAGHRSQFAIASGSGAAVATDILTEWNQGEHTKVHDKV